MNECMNEWMNEWMDGWMIYNDLKLKLSSQSAFQIINEICVIYHSYVSVWYFEMRKSCQCYTKQNQNQVSSLTPKRQYCLYLDLGFAVSDMSIEANAVSDKSSILY